MYRILMDQFMGFLPDTNNLTTNYTGDRGTSLLIRDEEYRHGSFIELVVRSCRLSKHLVGAFIPFCILLVS